jgi:general secretion pathway protein A
MQASQRGYPMYLSYFGLTEAPFSIAPDPRYLYMSKRHQEALAHLLFGLRGDGGFVLLTGEVGAGKTTVCRCLLEQVPEDCDLAYIFNPKLTVEELLAALCTEFRIELPAGQLSVKQLVDAINTFLLDGHAKGRHAVLIIDEAQNLSADVLEQMRLLTNLETHRRKLLQIILIGQPELATMLERPSLRQLAQRVVARYHLDPLNQDELAAYIRHRLEVAGAPRALFPKRLMRALYRYSGGVPRVLNLLCDRALLGTYVEGKSLVDAKTLARAAQEVFPAKRGTSSRSRSIWMVGGLVVCALLVIALIWIDSMFRAGFQQVYGHAEKLDQLKLVKTVSTHAANNLVTNQKTSVVPEIKVAEPSEIVWPAQAARELSTESAYAELYRAWHIAVPASGACAAAELRCRAARGSLDEIRSLNRPALLYLTEPDGKAMEGVLLGLKGNDATLVLGGETTTVPVSVLAAQWAGRYTVLWRPPTPLVDQIRPSDHGAAVVWLATQLGRVQGKQVELTSDAAFSEDLRRAVKQFQLEHGLTPDGQVGLQTLIRLSSAAEVDAPSLSHAKN